MSAGSRRSESGPGLRHRVRRHVHEVRRRMGWRHWYPHLPVAVGLALIGGLFSFSGAERALHRASRSVEVLEIEQHLNPLHYGPVLELAMGVSLLAISIGIAMRSRIAWMWSLAMLGIGISLRFPPALEDAPYLILVGIAFCILVFYRRHFAKRSTMTAGVFAVSMIAMFFTWATLGTLRLGDQFDPPVHDVATALYFSVVTVSSVGFGDIVARGEEARLFVTAMIALGLVVGATSLSAILLPLIGGRLREILGGRGHVERSHHYVIVGKSPLARNAAVELEKRKQRVTLILEEPSVEDFYRQRDVVVGDPADLAVLRTAGTERAKGVLALSPDDADNGFVVLGVNEIDPSIPTVAALNDAANESRVKRSQPSMLLSLQALGGQLLAMALTGEKVDVELLGRVLEVRGGGSGSGAEPEKRT